MPNDGLQWVSKLGKMSGVTTPHVDARIAGGSSALRSAGSAKSAKLTKEEIVAAMGKMDAFQADIDDALARYQAAKASADQLAMATGHKIEDPGKDLTTGAENWRKTKESWSKALQGTDRDAATKAGALATLVHDSVMRILTDYERAVQSAKPDKLPAFQKFKTPWGDLAARDDKGAATALSFVADLSKALAADNSNYDRYDKSADMLDHVLRVKPMADFLAKPESVQAAVQKAAQDNKGKIGEAKQDARHADSLERSDDELMSQLAAAKIQTDQMTESLAAIAKQVESEKAAEEAAELKEKAERIEGAFEFMGEVATVLTAGDLKEAGKKLGELALKTGFKLLGKLMTRDIRERAEDLKKTAHDKHNESLEKSSDALIKALEAFDKLAPNLEKKINEIAQRFESQMKQTGEKFDNVCENCTFHFYDVESAVKLAYKSLDAAASARQALKEDALPLPAAIGKAVLRTSQDLAGAAGKAMEEAFKRINGPTIDMARYEVERKIGEWKKREQKLGESLRQLLEVREKALQALADFGG
jgi:hypothetical protein